MNRRSTTVLLAVALSTLVVNRQASASPPTNAELKHRLDTVMANWHTADGAMPGAAERRGSRSMVVVVEDPRRGFRYASAVGAARAFRPEPLTVDHQFPIASVTKMMTAVLIYQLWEEGRLGPKGLDVPLGDLGVLPQDVLDRLDVYQGTRYGRDLTLRQLLGHRTGMRDVFVDDEATTSDENGGAPAPHGLGGRFVSAIAEHVACLQSPGCDPDLLWTRRHWRPWDASRPDEPLAGVLNYYLNNGHTAERALFAPGTAFHYSDTGYVILGLVIEHLTGRTLHQAYRARIIEKLGLGQTYLDYAANPPASRFADRRCDYFVGDIGGESAGFDLSFDWAGGGVVSTAGDLNTLIRALGEGRLLRPASLAELTHWDWTREREGFAEDRGYDVERIHAPDGSLFWGHFGVWGAAAFYEPATGITVAGTINQVDGAPTHWIVDLFRAMHDER